MDAERSAPARPKHIRIDVGSAGSAKALHALLADHLGFPAYYGKNWDAFDDIFNGSDSRLADRIEFVGMNELVARLPRDAQLLRESCLHADVVKNGTIIVVFDNDVRS